MMSRRIESAGCLTAEPADCGRTSNRIVGPRNGQLPKMQFLLGQRSVRMTQYGVGESSVPLTHFGFEQMAVPITQCAI